jgi:hypothetical protein
MPEAREVRGLSSAKTSRKGATSIVPSSTTEPLGSSFEVTLTPKGSNPARATSTSQRTSEGDLSEDGHDHDRRWEWSAGILRGRRTTHGCRL